MKRTPRIAVVLRWDVILHCSDADLLSALQLYTENGLCGLTWEDYISKWSKWIILWLTGFPGGPGDPAAPELPMSPYGMRHLSANYFNYIGLLSDFYYHYFFLQLKIFKTTVLASNKG